MTLESSLIPNPQLHHVTAAVQEYGVTAGAITAILFMIGVVVRSVHKGWVSLSHASRTYGTIVGDKDHEGLDSRVQGLERGQEHIRSEIEVIRSWQQDQALTGHEVKSQMEAASEQLATLNEQLAEVFETKQREKP